jgi:hypothetical protein
MPVLCSRRHLVHPSLGAVAGFQVQHDDCIDVSSRSRGVMMYNGFVPDEPRPPVAIRITRPYGTEEQYLEQELELISKTGITLVGAQPRAQGVVLRFELVLITGHVLVRGEGRVTGFKPNAHQGVGGLALRFTRIDARSKALLDKATALREARRPPSHRPPVETPSPPDVRQAPDSPPPSAPSAPVLPESRPPDVPARPGRASPLDAPPERNALLERLRTRAKGLDPAAVQRILESRRVISAR